MRTSRSHPHPVALDREPLRQIVENAGEDAAVILNRVKEGKEPSATTPPPASR